MKILMSLKQLSNAIIKNRMLINKSIVLKFICDLKI